jgi:hypothetical protein
MDRPKPLSVAWNILRVTRRTRRPHPDGIGSVDHSQLQAVLDSLATGGLPGLAAGDRDLSDYMAKLATVDPDTLTGDEALAYWINLYNAGGLRLAARAFENGDYSVLRQPGGFSRPIVEVSGEELSLDAIEHGKIRRFGDPRIHGALVCGSISCPTLRGTPYTGQGLSAQLDDQMAHFLAGGGAIPDGDDGLLLSRVFLWYGSDFARPHRMPTFIPPTKKRVYSVVEAWLSDELTGRSRLGFQPYDWGLRCSVG